VPDHFEGTSHFTEKRWDKKKASTKIQRLRGEGKKRNRRRGSFPQFSPRGKKLKKDREAPPSGPVGWRREFIKRLEWGKTDKRGGIPPSKFRRKNTHIKQNLRHGSRKEKEEEGLKIGRQGGKWP